MQKLEAALVVPEEPLDRGRGASRRRQTGDLEG
jgi:hypothetical protein